MYIAGESYGGIYVPYLAFENILAKAEDRLPIKGIIIANGVTDWTIDTAPAMAAMLFWHNLIDLDMEMKLKENNCFPWKLSVYAGKEGPRNEVECDSLMDTIMDDYLPGINPYDIYRTCYDNYAPGERVGKQLLNGKERSYKRGFTQSEYTPWFFEKNPKLKNIIPDCVSGQGVSDYFNRVDVYKSLHIDYEEENYQMWDLCTDRISYTMNPQGSIQYYDEIKNAGIRILHMSGNTDAVVPTEGTRQVMYELTSKGFDLEQDWEPYYIENGQAVGGFYEVREGLIFATVHGVGHMAPQWKPEAAYHLVTQFIENQPFRTKPKENTKQVTA